MIKEIELKAAIKAFNQCYEEKRSIGVVKHLAKDIVRIIEEIQEEEKCKKQ